MSANLTSKPVFGRHPHGGARAYIHFYDRHHRPCPEEDSFCGVYAEYDGNGIQIYTAVLYGC